MNFVATTFRYVVPSALLFALCTLFSFYLSVWLSAPSHDLSISSVAAPESVILTRTRRSGFDRRLDLRSPFWQSHLIDTPTDLAQC